MGSFPSERFFGLGIAHRIAEQNRTMPHFMTKEYLKFVPKYSLGTGKWVFDFNSIVIQGKCCCPQCILQSEKWSNLSNGYSLWLARSHLYFIQYSLWMSHACPFIILCSVRWRSFGSWSWFQFHQHRRSVVFLWSPALFQQEQNLQYLQKR